MGHRGQLLFVLHSCLLFFNYANKKVFPTRVLVIQWTKRNPFCFLKKKKKKKNKRQNKKKKSSLYTFSFPKHLIPIPKRHKFTIIHNQLIHFLIFNDKNQPTKKKIFFFPLFLFFVYLFFLFVEKKKKKKKT